MPGNFRRISSLGTPATLLVAAGCSGPAGGESLAVSRDAVNVCDETVPENRFVDGLPAYSQCDATTGSIWSNDGIDTATSSQGEGWVRTQQGGGYQCTEWAWRYMHFRWGVSYRHGDAREWCDGDLPDDLVLATTPVHGDLIVFDAGVCGADDTTGHIAVVDTVDVPGGRVTFVEQNRAGRRSSQQSCALCYLHAVANDGTPGTAGAAGTGGAPSEGGAPGSAGMTSAGGAPGAAGAAAGDGGTPGNGGSDSGGSAGLAQAGTGGALASAGAETTGAPAAGGATAQGAAPGSGGGSPTGPAGFGGHGMPPGSAGAPPNPGSGAGAAGLESGMDCSIGPRRGTSSGALLAVLALLGLGRRRRARPSAV